MKALSVILCMLLGVAFLRAEVDIGEERDAVIARLGSPQGIMEVGGREWVLWERGRVIFEDGIVVESSVLSREVFEVARARREKERAAAAEAARLRQEQEHAQGVERKKTILSDPAYYVSSAAGKIRMWQDFHRRYPTVDISVELRELVEEHRQELKLLAEHQRQIERQRDILELETQRAEAEARRAEAEQRTAESEERMRRRRQQILIVREDADYIIPRLPFVPRPRVPKEGEEQHTRTIRLYDGQVQGERTSGTLSTFRSFHGPL